MSAGLWCGCSTQSCKCQSVLSCNEPRIILFSNNLKNWISVAPVFHDCEDMKSWVISMHISDSECSINGRVVNMEWPHKVEWWLGKKPALVCGNLQILFHGNGQPWQFRKEQLLFSDLPVSHVFPLLAAFFFPDSGGVSYSFQKRTKKCVLLFNIALIGCAVLFFPLMHVMHLDGTILLQLEHSISHRVSPLPHRPARWHQDWQVWCH